MASVDRPKVAAARRLITRPKQLIEGFEEHLLAILVLGFGEKAFQEDEDPVPTADIAVVDLEGGTAVPVAVLSISWKRVVASLRLAEKGTWQVGKLVREPEFGAVEFHPPDDDFKLDEVPAVLARLEEPTKAGQLTLPMPDDPPADGAGGATDDGIPFR